LLEIELQRKEYIAAREFVKANVDWQTDTVWSIDTGLKIIGAGVRLTENSMNALPNPEPQNNDSAKVKNAFDTFRLNNRFFHHSTRSTLANRRTKQLLNKCMQPDSTVQQLVQDSIRDPSTIPSVKTSNFQTLLDSVQHRVKLLSEGSIDTVKGLRVIRKLKFYRYIKTQQTWEQVVDSLAGGRQHSLRKKLVIVVGDGQFSSGTSAGAGVLSSPTSSFTKQVGSRCKMLIAIDEYLTSQVCPNCNRITEFHEPKERNKRIRKCIHTLHGSQQHHHADHGDFRSLSTPSPDPTNDTTNNSQRTMFYNRDVMAAMNIGKLFLHHNFRETLDFVEHIDVTNLGRPKEKQDDQHMMFLKMTVPYFSSRAFGDMVISH
jgi:hypothetical protein